MKYPISSKINLNITTGLETLLLTMWGAHIQSISTALPKFTTELNIMSVPEMRFGESWAGIVEFIGKCSVSVVVFVFLYSGTEDYQK